jgi:hypothetical protein
MGTANPGFDVSRLRHAIDMLHQRGDALIDKIDGRSMLVYLEPETDTPVAMFVSAKAAVMNDKDVRWDDGTIVRLGMIVGRDGKPRNVERPQQIFTRWYGFAVTFPGCEIAGVPKNTSQQ